MRVSRRAQSTQTANPSTAKTMISPRTIAATAPWDNPLEELLDGFTAVQIAGRSIENTIHRSVKMGLVEKTLGWETYHCPATRRTLDPRNC